MNNFIKDKGGRQALTAVFGALLLTAVVKLPYGRAEPKHETDTNPEYTECEEPGKQITSQEAERITHSLGQYAEAFAVPPEEMDPKSVVCTVDLNGRFRFHIEAGKQEFVDAAEQGFGDF